MLVQHLNPKEEGGKFVDSLKHSGVDTIIGYYKGCSGCVSGVTSEYYVFWIKSNESFVTKFNELTNYNVLRSYFPFSYVSTVYVELRREKLRDPKLTTSHYIYESVSIFFDDEEYEYDIVDFEKKANENSLKVNLIDKLRANLLIINKDWKGQNYIKRKVSSKF